MLNIIAWLMNRRYFLTGIATGDQVIFVTKEAFAAVGQYPEIALMKDIALSKALKKSARRFVLTPKSPAPAEDGSAMGYTGLYC
jgi:hypothetical protein